MSDPQRLLNGTSGQHELERSLLESVRVVTVPAQARGLVWGALSVTLAEATAMAGSAPLWRGALKVLVSHKALVAVPVLVAALGVGVLAHQHSRPAAALVAHSVALAPQAAPLAVAAPERLVDPVAPTEAAEPLAPRHSSLSERLRQESALLTRARAELRGGNPRAAQATLSQMQRVFGSGALGQERTVLNIEALAAQGNRAAAARGARAFIAAHPESPHAATLRRFLTQP